MFSSHSPKFLNVRQVAEKSRRDHMTFSHLLLHENCLEESQLKENTSINKSIHIYGYYSKENNTLLHHFSLSKEHFTSIFCLALLLASSSTPVSAHQRGKCQHGTLVYTKTSALLFVQLIRQETLASDQIGIQFIHCVCLCTVPTRHNFHSTAISY